MLLFREQIREAGFLEASLDFMQFHFYRRTTEKAAVILNLQDLGEYIRVVYGVTSIPDEEYFEKHGEANDEITLRYSAELRDEKDGAAAARAMTSVFDRYRDIPKDEILATRKEKQKAYLQKINERLTPFGFKKKGPKWTRALDNGSILEFYAEKARWSDEYYFNISVYPTADKSSVSYQTSITKNAKEKFDWQWTDDQKFDWQLMNDREFNDIMESALKILLPMINS